jgi:hypothetical protein
LHQALIDGGPATTYENLRDFLMESGRRHLDLVVVTHVDGDHIEGVVRLLQDRTAIGLSIGDVWFNGWPQLERAHSGQAMGPDQGEMLGALLLRDELPWNSAFGHEQAVRLPAQGSPPCIPLPGGATATVLGPGPDQLQMLRTEWTRVLRRANVVPGRPDLALRRLARRRSLRGLGEPMGSARTDDSVANASSICLLIEHQGRSVLVTGDGHGDVLAAGIRRLLDSRGIDRLPIDVLKLPHHGSAANVTEELLDLVDCARFVFSTNGAYHQHPDASAVERVIAMGERLARPLELIFNYDCPTTSRWRQSFPGASRRYETRYPQSSRTLTIDVEQLSEEGGSSR